MRAFIKTSFSSRRTMVFLCVASNVDMYASRVSLRRAVACVKRAKVCVFGYDKKSLWIVRTRQK